MVRPALFVRSVGSDKVSCVVKVGGEPTNVSLNTKVGSSALASIGAYSVAFSIEPGWHSRSEAKDAQGRLYRHN